MRDPLTGTTTSTIVAGSATGTAGFKDGVGTAAQFRSPRGMAVDARGNIYVADRFNYRIRRVAPDGTVTTVAGNGQDVHANQTAYTDGDALSVPLDSPQGVILSPNGGLLIPQYFADSVRHLTGTMKLQTVAGLAYKEGTADGSGADARFIAAYGIAPGRTPDVAFVAEYKHGIRRLRLPMRCDDGDPCTADSCNTATKSCEHATIPACAAVQPCVTPNYFYPHRWGSKDGTKGSGNDDLSFPWAVVSDPDGTIWVAETGNHRIMRRKGITGTPRQVFGSGVQGDVRGVGTAAQINAPRGMAAGPSWIYFSDDEAKKIRRFHKTTLASEPIWTAADFSTAGDIKTGPGNILRGLALAPDHNTLFVSDGANDRVVSVGVNGADKHVVRLLAGSGSPGCKDGLGNAAQFNEPSRLAVGPNGVLYVADRRCNNIRRLTAAIDETSTIWTVTTIAGSAAGTQGHQDSTVGLSALFAHPVGLTMDAEGKLYSTSTLDNTIRLISPKTDGTWEVDSVMGVHNDLGHVFGEASKVRLYQPRGITVSGTTAWVAQLHDVSTFETGQCGDHDPCTVDSCDASTGRCQHVVISGCK